MVDVPPELPQWLAVGGGSAWAARKLFGGSLDVVGEALERWTRSRLENVGRITENALKKSGSDLERPGVVPARVAMRVFDEGSYSDDDVVIEYLGGVLASSRTPQGRDDRGNTWTKLVAGLSTYELRYHYICYRLLREHLVGNVDVNLHDMALVAGFAVHISTTEMDAAMAFEADENPQVIRDHCEIWPAARAAPCEGGDLRRCGRNADTLARRTGARSHLLPFDVRDPPLHVGSRSRYS